MDNMEIIQQKTLEYFERTPIRGKKGSTWTPGFWTLDWDSYSAACPEIVNAFSRYGLTSTWAGLVVMIEQEDMAPHLDYLNPEFMQCRINIPLLNCEGSRTLFYSIPQETFVMYGEVGYDISRVLPPEFTNASDYIATEVEINQPTVIRVQHGHHIIMNPKATPRLCLTIKMDKDPVFLLEE